METLFIKFLCGKFERLYKRKGKFEIKRAKLGKFNELNLNKAASQISFQI
ncbi:hypothetical protein CAMSH0001_1044 [Campylobacter showae RM3277]|uniref:Uncharacterized protein n=1 Tax=Campylobacter showae RM3277 TaxID=553219 RepID=C6RHU0_9BACT|nr:hypothetical protein CAMSH0001_1044 [Campylobacter showae RM3277]